MSFESELREKLSDIFNTSWKSRDGEKVPEAEDVTLGNDAVKLEATVLYADLAGSTDMVLQKKPEFASEVYKSFLDSACRVIRNNDGLITAFDGDRVMAVFVGKSKNTNAVLSALNINWAVTVVNEELRKVYTKSTYVVKHCVGVDTSPLWVAKTGIRNSNDLVWVGRSANFAAKLCSLRDGDYASYITDDVYNNCNDSSLYTNKNGYKDNMWESHTWGEQGRTVYRST
jgi:uridylate cyclase